MVTLQVGRVRIFGFFIVFSGRLALSRSDVLDVILYIFVQSTYMGKVFSTSYVYEAQSPQIDL